MSEETPVTAHVHACVKVLNEWFQARETDRLMEKSYPLPSDADAFESLFELIDLPWDEHTEEDGMFREGYETCLLDVVDAISQAWGVKLPELKLEER